MAYKTILVHAEDDPTADGRLDLALSVGRLFGATTLGVAAETWYPFAASPDYSFVPGEVLENLEQECLRRLEGAQLRFQERVRAAGLESLWASEVDFPRDALIRHARSADLIVASRCAGPHSEARSCVPADLIMGAGLPVLVKAETKAAITAEHVVVGWKNTREARRAVTEALPFLERASGVTLAQAAHDGEVETARADLEAAAGRLARRGVKASIKVIQDCRNICEGLESVAVQQGADLIVVGAYGHSSWRETVFGGVTQGLLEHGVMHVLFSH
jgi:nucleotide-binding universal stress UspA family protein